MSLEPIRIVQLLVVAWVCASIAGAPIATADEPRVGEGSADVTIADLEADGYNVAINWVGGSRNLPLAQCRAVAIHNPDRSGERPQTFTTVYVDVACPDDDWGDSGIGFGIGFG
jgi:hypothetical protein